MTYIEMRDLRMKNNIMQKQLKPSKHLDAQKSHTTIGNSKKANQRWSHEHNRKAF